MPTNGKRIAYGRNQVRVPIATYPDDTSVPVRTSHWNQDPHDQAILGFTKITATLDSSGVIYTKDDSSTTLEDDGNTYSRQSTLIEVECEGTTTVDAIVKIDITDTNENDIIYLYKGTDSDAITIASGTPSVAGHIKTQLSGGATLVHDGVPIMLIRRGDYWYEFGADGAASSFTAISSDTLENKTINTSDNTITVASADVTGLSTSLGLKAPIANPTFTGTVTTAAVDVAGNNIDNVQNIIHDQTDYASVTGATTVNFGHDQLQTYALTGNITISTSGSAAGKSKTMKITPDGTDRTVTVPATWTWVGTNPTTSNVITITASKTAILTLTAFGGGDANIVAAYAVEE